MPRCTCLDASALADAQAEPTTADANTSGAAGRSLSAWSAAAGAGAVGFIAALVALPM